MDKATEQNRHYYIYILRCVNDSFYTGIALNITKRLKEHAEGSPKSKFTRANPPVSCEACWHISGGRGEAQRIEAMIKKLSRREKEELIKNSWKLKSLCTTKGFPREFSVRKVKLNFTF